MARRRLSLFALALLAMMVQPNATAFAGSKSAAIPLMKALVGTWDCSYRGDDGAARSTETNRLLNNFWLASSIEHGARPGHFPAHHHDAWIGYDSKRRVWLELHIGSGGSYGIDKSAAGPGAKEQRWITEYPPSKADSGYTVITFAQDKIVRRQYWTENGRNLTSSEICNRRR